MATLGEDIIGASGLPPFFEVANADAAGIETPVLRLGDALRTSVRALSGFQKEALVRSARTGKAWRLVSDEGPYLNGHDAAPCPLAFLSAGMAASYMEEMLALARDRGARLDQLKLSLDNYYTMKGSMRDRTMVGGAEAPELVVDVASDLDDAALMSLLTDAVHASPLNGLLRGQLTSLFRLSRNGVELPTLRAKQLPSPLLPDPATGFERVKPIGTPELVGPVGPTPKKPVEKGTATSGSSLSDEQDRRLNIGAVAELRGDGIKDIRHMQFSPWGTSFRILSEEAPEAGGQARAPDAHTLISAGIGFCFMTQFGRFVSMLGLDLPDYRITQDTHFSLGGASAGTGAPGRADPVETHVYLETGEPDYVAQEMLDISEITCFLHALCRTDLKVKLRINRV